MNLPIIIQNIFCFHFQRCSDYMASGIPTFARTEPPDTQVTKSVISLMTYYGWRKFSIVHEQGWDKVATSLKNQAERKNMTINHIVNVPDVNECCAKNMECCLFSFYTLVQKTMNRTRIYVYLGIAKHLSEFMTNMERVNLFDNGEYMVIYVDMMTYSIREAAKYLYTTDQISKCESCTKLSNFLKRARSLLVIVSTPPTENYGEFTNEVKTYSNSDPFNFSLPPIFSQNNYTKVIVTIFILIDHKIINLKYFQFVSIYAAYLYDSIMLYAWALDQLLRNETILTEDVILDVASNGSRIIETIIRNRTYRSNLL